MSSFKRKNPAKTKAVSYPGTRVSPASSSTINVSTGISSLDDILGGGLPLSCSLVVAAPDLHSSYGELVQKYFIAEGLATGQRVYIVDNDPEGFVDDVMWFPKSTTPKKVDEKSGGSDEEEEGGAGGKVKIAWRYEQMKQFQTTVSTPSQTSENYCHIFDLTSRVPRAMVEDSRGSGKLKCLKPSSSLTHSAISTFFGDLENTLKEDSSLPVRICVPSLGSSLAWGDLSAQEILLFLNQLRRLLRKYPYACASTTLSPHLSVDQWGGPGWLQKVGWSADGFLSMAAFPADPALSSMFPSHHGMVRLYSLPSPNTLVSPSDRFSALRGLASSSSAFGGTGENNLAFKCTRKRLIFETLHLDLEGGVSERRTTAPSMATTEVSAASRTSHTHGGPGAKIDIQLEGAEEPSAFASEKAKTSTEPTIQTPEGKPKRPKKKVAFFSDRPDVYDF
ncbi:hypothetical protein CC1G_03690 [Coprinopsis cinerea okayama7|uniref:Elongator complex protein 4 n=1 Tax=Coprinopsis cinerea (strain Okayama-7 / 130 / ATCC MYA-4618 / FGSC 9003) TaxID=240176 RepID=A8N1Z7_COPC7|nr:hypothetical protein CC1G_03690 [Coprinopsis cinerea okayama7\|eukprot:XP_001828896.2 hypothetical protein CC1G_03690 [Coprinopsis cinerea okayama7\